MVYLFAVLGGLGLIFIFYSLEHRTARIDPLQEALRIYGQPQQYFTRVDEIELQKSFRERVVVPFQERIRQILGNSTPEKTRQQLHYKLLQAGRPGNFSPADFMIARYAAAIFGFAVFLVLGIALQSTLVESVGALGAALGGYYGPILVLNQQIEGRRKEMLKGLPDALDLLLIQVEAGLGFDAALEKVTEKYKNALSAEFGVVLNEIRLGRERFDAFEEMAKRAGVEEVHNFVQAMIQSQAFGVGIANILRIQADDVRRRRRQKAQEKAAQATLKMMLPMVGCIFPVIWIVLIGPAILLLLHAAK